MRLKTWKPDGRKRFVPPNVIFENEKDNFHEVSTEGSDIVEFFKGKSIFITGATGFVGKLLMEKLLRVCPDIENIFILCRDKKGKDLHTRIDEIFNDVVYTRLSKTHPKFRHKVIPIRGDVSIPGLGISPEDRKLITSKVEIIFHGAATVRFDEHIKVGTMINVQGTREALLLGKDCKKLLSFVCVGTAYSNSNRKTVEEILYPMKHGSDFIKYVESKTDEELEALTPKLLEDWPNTYTFTKALAEQVVKEYGKGMPVCIFRPGIVVSTYSEPVRGWTDNLYGPSGACLGVGLGILRSLHGDPDAPADMVPCDYVVNAIIAAAYNNTKLTNPIDIPIYNFVSADNCVTWQSFALQNMYYGDAIPALKCLWYYDFRFNKNVLIHWIFILLFHYLPAILVDGLTLMVGKKPQLLKMYKKIHKFADVISYFQLHSWDFRNENVRNLWGNLKDVDKRVFPFDMSSLDWERHAEMNMLGLRIYLLKEDLSTLPQAKIKRDRLRLAHYLLKAAFIFVLLRIIYAVLSRIFL